MRHINRKRRIQNIFNNKVDFVETPGRRKIKGKMAAEITSLPSIFKIYCIYCFYNTTDKFQCQIGYVDKATELFKFEYGFCEGGPPLPFPSPNGLWYGPFQRCLASGNPHGLSTLCNTTLVSRTSLNTNCLGPLGRKHSYQCKPKEVKWMFHPKCPCPEDADFPNYSIMELHTALGGICCALTLILNLVVSFVFLRSRSLRSSLTIVYAAHMTIIDLLIGFSVLPLYLLQVYSYNHYTFTGEKITSDETFKTISSWVDSLDLIFLVSSFTNLAAYVTRKMYCSIKTVMVYGLYDV